MVSKSTQNRVSGLCRNRQMSTQLRQILTAVAKNNNNNDIFHDCWFVNNSTCISSLLFFSTTMRLMQVPCMCVRRFGAWLI